MVYFSIIMVVYFSITIYNSLTLVQMKEMLKKLMGKQ